MVPQIVTKLGAPQYIVSLGLGFTNVNVTVNAAPIRLDFTLHATVQITVPTVIVATPIRLNFVLDADTIIVPGNKIFAQPIRLNFQLTGSAIGTDIFILDFEAKVNFTPCLEATINTELIFLAPVELEEGVARVRIT